MVRCADKATAVKVKSTAPPALIFFDGDGAEFMRVDGITPDSIEGHMRSALSKYASKEVAWGDEAAAGGKPVAHVFVDERKESQQFLTSLSDRWLAKHHEKLVFVKHAFARDDAKAKELGATSAPALVLVKDGKVVDRLVAKTQVPSIRAFLLKNFAKLK